MSSFRIASGALALALALTLTACGTSTVAPAGLESPNGATCDSHTECASGLCIGQVCRSADEANTAPGNNADPGDNNDRNNTDPGNHDAGAGDDNSDNNTGTDDTGDNNTPDDASDNNQSQPDAMVEPDTNANNNNSNNQDQPDAMVEPDTMVEPDVPEMGTPLDCDGLAANGHSVCSATEDTCAIVFYDESGCEDACASAGMECVASFRDHDDNGVELCAPHPEEESYGCADTGHRSDYCICQPGQGPERAFEGAEGFGALAEGGRGGTVYTVTNLNDAGQGSLRWAVERSGRRIVQFDVDGVIRLRSALNIRDPNITIDGRGALDPGEEGITIRDYPIDIRTHDVIIRYIRVRLGDWAVLKRNDDENRTRPASSRDLDCINIDQSRNVIIDHVSMSWSTDEIVSVTNSRNVTIQWSILSEPIGNWRTHPYGDNHAFAANNSAATLSYHHNLFAHYRFRGPQFEANDMQRSSPPFDAKFEAVNNVVYGYTSNGSRYRTGFERDSDRVTSVDFSYHFVNNRYVNPNGSRTEIEAAVNFGSEDNIHVYVNGNIGPNRPNNDMDQLAVVYTDGRANDSIRQHNGAMRQVSETPLFSSPVPITLQSAQDAHDAVLAGAGCDIERDAIDQRIVNDVLNVRPGSIIESQEDVPGGWNSY